MPRNNNRIFLAEEKYWRKFYTTFTGYLFTQRGCFDAYVGAVIKVIRVFFNYLNKERLMNIGHFHDRFYVLKEQIPVIALLPEQVAFLMNNEPFEKSLSLPLRRTKDIFVFGCMVALRFGDLFNIRASDIEEACGSKYLSIKTAKTGVAVKIKLTGYTLRIIEKLQARAGKRKLLVPRISRNQFNENIKAIAEKAGWTMPLPKTRNRRGKETCIYRPGTKKVYRFCDLLSSHCMRRTAITMMLMLGIPEHIVRMISGHTSNSKSFYRYVSLAQSYLDNYIEQMGVQLSTFTPA